MAIDISHLVVIGCSLAYCQGLESPKTQGWPALIGNGLGVPVVNLSGKGAGNDKIMRRLFEYHYLNLKHNNNPLYIISFSHSSRREEYINRTNDYTVVDMHVDATDKCIDEFSRPCIVNYNQEVLSRRKLMIQAYILNFLKGNNINYLFTDYLPDHPELDEMFCKALNPEAYNEVYFDKYKLKNFNDFSKNHTPLPCLHDGLEVQQEIFEYTMPKINELYGEVNPVNKPFATLSDYADNYAISGIIRGIESDWF